MPGDRLSFSERLAHGWNVFRNKDPDNQGYFSGGPQVSYVDSMGHSHRLSAGIDKTIALSIYNRISVDTAMATVEHVRVDENGNYIEPMSSYLQDCLTISANVDQTGRAFLQDLVYSMLDDGVAAAVPVDTTVNPELGSFDIHRLRVGKVVSWQAQSVRIEAYDERDGKRKQFNMDKNAVAIVQNPFYEVMNEPNSTLRRLTHKLSLLDVIDEQNASGKLDLIIQLPYTIKSESRQKQAEKRRKQLEEQLQNSQYGIGYIDGTERITQLNRAVESNMLDQIEYLTRMLYSQLGLTDEIMNGTATEEAMINYYKRTIDPILTAIVDEFTRKFLTKTARTQNQRIKFHRNPFELTTATVIADVADKFTRNEILAPNELRGIVGFKPSKDPSADELRNRNISQSSEEIAAKNGGIGPDIQNGGETDDG